MKRIFVPRTDPDSWKIEPAESAPAVPQGSQLIGIPVAELESRYKIKIRVQEGNEDTLEAHSFLYVSGLGEAVDTFTADIQILSDSEVQAPNPDRRRSLSNLIRITGKQKIFRGKFIKLWGTDFLDKNGDKQLWEWIEKAQAVLVFPITDDGNVILIKNFRVPLERYVIEIPAGLRDKPGESAEEVARRELLEEAGYIGKNFTPVPAWPYRAGSSNGMIQAFIATGLTKVSDDITGDATEDITVMEVQLHGLTDFYFSLPDDILFQPEIFALCEMSKHLKLAPPKPE